MVQGKRDLKINLFKLGGQRQQWNEIHDINIDIDVQQQKKKKIMC